jgi:hypothetical protein
MASIYAAIHRNNKRVAVKMLHPELSMNAAIRLALSARRVRRELSRASRCRECRRRCRDRRRVRVSGDGVARGRDADARWERKGPALRADGSVSGDGPNARHSRHGPRGGHRSSVRANQARSAETLARRATPGQAAIALAALRLGRRGSRWRHGGRIWWDACP